MAADWKKFLDGLKNGTGAETKEALSDLISTAKNDADAFIKRQGEKVELYLNELAAGQITAAQLASYAEDVKTLTEMQALKMEVQAQVRAQKLAIAIGTLVISKFISLLKI